LSLFIKNSDKSDKPDNVISDKPYSSLALVESTGAFLVNINASVSGKKRIINPQQNLLKHYITG
jgi:hypothetical protein